MAGKRSDCLRPSDARACARRELHRVARERAALAWHAVRSQALRITGECDLVELHHDKNGIAIHGRSGTWRVFPVEYKHGQPDERGADEMQLCAQALCLEEMLATEIPDGCNLLRQDSPSRASRLYRRTEAADDRSRCGNAPLVRAWPYAEGQMDEGLQELLAG